MRNAIVSFAFYMIMILLCIVCQFVDQNALIFAFFFAAYTFLLSPSYQASCKPIEWKDFLFALLFTVFCAAFWWFNKVEFNLDNLWVIYTVNFIASVNLGCSHRYKILI